MKYYILLIVDLIKFLRPSFAGTLVKCGVALEVLSFGGYKLIFEYDRYINNGHVAVGISTSETSEIVLNILGIFGAILLISGFWIGIKDWAALRRNNSRKKNIIIELRGLSATLNQSLKSSISTTMTGQVDDILVEIGRHVTAGTPSELEKALDKVNNIHTRIETAIAGKDPGDISIHAGTVAPTPFQFLFGVILDDEFSPNVWEYERLKNEWQTLDQNDPSIVVNELIDPLISSQDTEVVVSVAATFAILDSTISNTWPNLKVAKIENPTATPNSIWTEADQILIVESFLRIMALLKNRGVKKIHLALAASPSICLRLGRHFDQRNLPEVTVYQFDRSLDRYTWGVEIASIGTQIDPKKGKLVHSN